MEFYIGDMLTDYQAALDCGISFVARSNKPFGVESVFRIENFIGCDPISLFQIAK